LAGPGGTEAKFVRASELILQALPLPHNFDIPTTSSREVRRGEERCFQTANTST